MSMLIKFLHARIMSAGKKGKWCWKSDLAAFRGLTDRDRAGFLVLLEWMGNFWLRLNLEAGRDAATAFWKEEVTGHGRVREEWQLDQWSAAVSWYLNWLKACEEEGADHRSVPERLRVAVRTAGARRPRTTDQGVLWGLGFARDSLLR
jgi:hypothetical protein